MHPLIAWLAFLFSPSEDWLLKRAYSLVLEPTQIQLTIDSYEDMARRYPTETVNSDQTIRSADAMSLAQWANWIEPENRSDADQLRQKAASLKNVDPLIAARINTKIDTVQTDSPEDLMRQAKELKNAGEWQKALALWQELSKKYPRSIWAEAAQFNVAETYFLMGDQRLSRAAFKTWIETFPNGANRNLALFRVATMDVKSGDTESALTILQQIQLPETMKERGFLVSADCLIKTKRTKDLLDHVKRNDNTSTEGQFQLSWALAFDGHFEKALSLSEKTLNETDHSDTNSRLFLLQALLYEQLAHPAEALATYQLVVDHYPNTSEAALAVHGLLLNYGRSNRWAEAVTQGSHLWAQIPPSVQFQNPDAEYWLAEAHSKLGRSSDAMDHYSAFLSMAPNDDDLRPYAHFQLAAVLAREKRFDLALEHLNQFAGLAEKQQNKDWVSLAHAQSGHILFHNRKFDQAITEYRLSSLTKARYFEGVALANLDYYGDAVAVWKSLAQTFPSDPHAPQALFKAGRTEFELGRATEAVATFAQFAQTYPSHSLVKSAALQSAHALFNAGKVQGALTLFKDYLARYSSLDDVATVTPFIAACYAQLNTPLAETEAGLKGLPPTQVLAELRWQEGAKHFNNGQYKEASDIFSRLLVDTPAFEQSPLATFYRGESYMQNQEWASAAGAYNNVLTIGSAETINVAPQAMFRKGVALYNQDKLLAAAEQFETMLNRYPNDKLSNDAKQNLYLCHYNLGNWPTMQLLKNKYGEPQPMSTVMIPTPSDADLTPQ